MMERRVPITVEEAVRKVMGFTNCGVKELVPLELAYGRTLADDLVADHMMSLLSIVHHMTDLLLGQKILLRQVMRTQLYLK